MRKCTLEGRALDGSFMIELVYARRHEYPGVQAVRQPCLPIIEESQLLMLDRPASVHRRSPTHGCAFPTERVGITRVALQAYVNRRPRGQVSHWQVTAWTLVAIPGVGQPAPLDYCGRHAGTSALRRDAIRVPDVEPAEGRGLPSLVNDDGACPSEAVRWPRLE